MKVIVNRKDFLQSLSLGSSFSGKNKALAALDYTRLVFNGNVCRITSNDGEMAITTTYILKDAMVGEDTMYVEAKTLINALKSIKEDELTIGFEEKSCVVKHSRGVFNVPYGDVDTYPIPQMDKDSTNLSVESETLFNWLKEARQFVADDQLRPVMNGVYLYVRDNQIGVCASDGHKLYADSKPYNSDAMVDAILSSKAISTLLDTINNTENTTIFFGERNVAFKAGNTSIMCRKIDGRYPNFKSVIPSTYKFSVECNKEDFVESISRCLIMANQSSLIRMKVNTDTSMELVAEDIDFSRKGQEFVDVENNTLKNGHLEIGFKGTFANICMSAISSDKVRFELTDATRAIVMKDLDNEDKTLLLMPMAIQ